MPKSHAVKYPQGPGRQEPNNDPFLPPPEGRIKLSINPIDMLKQIIPPKVWAKLFSILLGVACCALCVMMLPMIVSNVITKVIIG
jgi:hypothetical protein